MPNWKPGAGQKRKAGEDLYDGGKRDHEAGRTEMLESGLWTSEEEEERSRYLKVPLQEQRVTSRQLSVTE